MPVLSNARHEAFAQGLAKGMTADASYEAAGYKPNRHNAARLKTNEHIRTRVEGIVSEGARVAQVDVARVLQELARVGTSDIRKLFTDGGGLRDIKDIDDDTAAAIASVEVVTKMTGGENEDGSKEVEHIHKFRFWDKNSALEKIGKHLGMFTDKVDHTSSDGSMSPKPSVNLTSLSDEELAQLERLTDKARDQGGVGEA